MQIFEAGTFGTAYRGSSLETVVHGVAGQRQMFKGADHIAGLLFDIGSGRYTAPPLPGNDTADARAAWEVELARARANGEVDKAQTAADRQDTTHTEVQGWLRDLGLALGFDVWIASNDRSHACGGGRLGDGCLTSLPSQVTSGPAADAIGLIDVLWLEREGHVLAAFEVEHTTSVYSGIVRMLDLALSGDPGIVRGLYLVAPDSREEEVRAQLRRPAFSRVSDLHVRYYLMGNWTGIERRSPGSDTDSIPSNSSLAI